MQHWSNKWLTPLLVLAAAAMLAAGLYWLRPQPRLLAVASPRFEVMGTFGQIQLRCHSSRIGQEALDAAMAALDQVDKP